MPQSLSKVYTHIIFSTHERYPWIDDAIEDRLFAYLGKMCRSLECQPIKTGGYRDHVHILCILSRKIAIMQLVKDVKVHSSRWMKEQSERYSGFYWQQGYGIFSVSQSHAEQVKTYIAHQRQHHQKMSFQEEYLGFLKKYEVEYDEKYVWD